MWNLKWKASNWQFFTEGENMYLETKGREKTKRQKEERDCESKKKTRNPENEK